MEVVSSIIGAAVTETGRSLFGFYPSLKNFIRFKSNLRSLAEENRNLLDLRNRVIEDVESSDAQMTQWLREVEKIMLEVNSVQAAMTANDSRISRKRYRLSNEIARMLNDVERLLKEGNIAAKLVGRNYLAKAVEHIPGPCIETQTTASKLLAKLMDLLNEDDVKRIGVWGMGGVGKTTLVTNLNNNLKNSSSTLPFGIIIWATVSQKLDPRKVQVQIAERLNLEVHVQESDKSIAKRLFWRLGKEKFLLILDDVWDTIDLDSLGVPRPEDHSGSKILLTSRSFEVCRKMKTDKQVKVEVLNDKESWQLFTENAGEAATSKYIEPIARAVAKECGGLPLAIITVGKAMREKTRLELWKDVLSELQSSDVPDIEGIENTVFKPLKLSYDSLRGKNIKPCFLYCSLYPEDFSIDASELVKCWLGEGLIEERKNYEESYNRGIALIEKLKDSCLLEHGAREGTVKLHDVVRVVAIWISSSLEDECKSLVRSGIDLTHISVAEMLQSHKRVSFMYNKLTELPDSVICCPKALSLLLQGNFILKRIPDGFFLAFPSLKVLNLSRTHIRSLPESMLHLVDLQVLILRGCSLQELSVLGRLSKLQVLDCCETTIRELPSGMRNLSNLRQLYLSRTNFLRTIKEGTISGLSNLEVLDMTGSAYIWGVKQQANEAQANFSELLRLGRLLVLSISLEEVPILGSKGQTWIGKLRRFQFVVGRTDFLQTELDGKRVTLVGLNPSTVMSQPLLTNATSLVLDGCEEIQQIKPTYSFTGLKSLAIANTHWMDSITSVGVPGSKLDLLPNLEELHLHDVWGLKSISELVQTLNVRLSRLRILEVTRCPRLRFLLQYGGNLKLNTGKLEVIRVSFCDELRQLFWHTHGEIKASGSVVPNLRIIEVTNCDALRKLPVRDLNPNAIEEIRGDEHWWARLERHSDEDIKISVLHSTRMKQYSEEDIVEETNISEQPFGLHHFTRTEEDSDGDSDEDSDEVTNIRPQPSFKPVAKPKLQWLHHFTRKEEDSDGDSDEDRDEETKIRLQRFFRPVAKPKLQRALSGL